ncbi:MULTISPECIES: hypothetical protein [Streptomyces]|uniref:hypothetical protein n=1 Tax=Streptomyces TaxID=1883 RepID=UPI001E2F525E|nr:MULTISPECIES: hypothetical protein [Streptomyces]UFQ18775.1 hypothetical protein J2N69_29460 [Streptomyces huasconensis]WCL88392.1 hypothetical protein PPN52_29425 [Streptomyces sp. JCM 35825]
MAVEHSTTSTEPLPGSGALSGPGHGSQWLTLTHCKRVLVVVHTEVYGSRLRDVLPLLESDLRIQIHFTIAPHAFNAGAERILRALNSTALPWEEAVRQEFDLVLAAGSQGIDRLRGPLLRMPHGAGHIKLSRTTDDRDPGAPRTVGELGRQYLTRDGKVVPKALALAHSEDLATLARTCPEALPVSEVVGDASYDRVVASLPLRRHYRTALGLRRGQRLILVSSTWGLGSSFNRLDALLPRLLTELEPARYRIAVLVHPNVWAGHGDWQVRSWLAAAERRGITVLPPDTDWRVPLIAADWVIGDHGSVTLYATLTRAVILLARYPSADINPDSPAAELARAAPALSPAHPLPEQLAYARTEYPAEEYARIGRRISSEPGRFARNTRRLMYRLLSIGQPAYEASLPVLPVPAAPAGTGAADGIPA